ncbi:MAG: hypothetical protein KF715_09985 [Candidatus Didemnitutus sp.]|nr:hypothetical protein [Candidatus Didemnitutus sp.]
MKTSAFLSSLRAHAALPVVFRSGSVEIAPQYHLTEVKRVAYETMDCGAQTHRWSETQFELWVPSLTGDQPGRDHMPAGKFLAIIDRVEKELPLDGDTPARIFVALGDAPAALYDIASVHAVDGRLHIELTADRARCKAAERRTATLTGGCCGSDHGDGNGCCASESAAQPAAACCA